MFMRPSKSVAVFLVHAMLASTALVTISACTTTQEERIGKNDGTDACYAYRVALDETRSFFAEDMLKAALAGAAVGLVAAAVGGGNAGQVAVATLAGALVGAAVGGFWSQLEQQQGRSGAINAATGSARKDRENLQKTEAALDNLLKCRRGEIAVVKADYKAKRINKAEAERRLAAIKASMDRDYEIAQDINKNVGKRQEEYLFALNQVKPGAGDRAKNPSKKPPANAKNPEQQFEAETAGCVLGGQNVNRKTNEFAQAAARETKLEG